MNATEAHEDDMDTPRNLIGQLKLMVTISPEGIKWIDVESQ